MTRASFLLSLQSICRGRGRGDVTASGGESNGSGELGSRLGKGIRGDFLTVEGWGRG